jgi:hypothetical protein
LPPNFIPDSRPISTAPGILPAFCQHFASICQHLPASASICQHLPAFCQHLPASASIWWKLVNLDFPAALR